jgi:hypothetical protein
MGNDYSTCCQSRATAAANDKDLSAKARRLTPNTSERSAPNSDSVKEVPIQSPFTRRTKRRGIIVSHIDHTHLKQGRRGVIPLATGSGGSTPRTWTSDSREAVAMLPKVRCATLAIHERSLHAHLFEAARPFRNHRSIYPRAHRTIHTSPASPRCGLSALPPSQQRLPARTPRARRARAPAPAPRRRARRQARAGRRRSGSAPTSTSPPTTPRCTAACNYIHAIIQ